MKVNGRIVLSILIIPVVIGILHGVSILLPIYLTSQLGLSIAGMSVFLAYKNLMEHALNPFIVFTVAYFLAGDLDVKAELGMAVISVFLSCFLGVFIGYVIGYGYMANLLRDFENFPIGVFSGLIDGLYFGSLLFCVSFAAIAIAYLKKSRAHAQMQ